MKLFLVVQVFKFQREKCFLDLWLNKKFVRWPIEVLLLNLINKILGFWRVWLCIKSCLQFLKLAFYSHINLLTLQCLSSSFAACRSRRTSILLAFRILMRSYSVYNLNSCIIVAWLAIGNQRSSKTFLGLSLNVLYRENLINTTDSFLALKARRCLTEPISWWIG